MLIAKTLREVLGEDIQDLHSAEKHVAKALERMSVAVSNDQAKNLFSKHLEKSGAHLQRLEKAAQRVGIAPEGRQCSGVMGIAMDMECYIRSRACCARDIQLICTVQKMVNYQLVAYSSARAIAGMLKMPSVINLLRENFEEKYAVKLELAAMDENPVPIQFSPPPSVTQAAQKAAI